MNEANYGWVWYYELNEPTAVSLGIRDFLDPFFRSREYRVPIRRLTTTCKMLTKIKWAKFGYL